MKEENKNGQLPEKEQLLSSLRNAEVCLYVSVYKDAVCPV